MDLPGLEFQNFTTRFQVVEANNLTGESQALQGSLSTGLT